MLLVVVSDPVGIRTRDPQLRRLLLYPAELPDLVGMRLSQERRLSASLWRPRFLLLTQTREVWVILRPLVAIVTPIGEFSKTNALVARTMFAKTDAGFYFARQNTRVGTIVRAYKGNLGAKVLLFFDLCKSRTKKLQKFLKKFL